MAYLLFKLKDWNPSRYYDMGRGEKTVTQAFMELQIEEDNEERKQKANLFDMI